MADWISFSLCLLACHVAFTLTDALNFLSTRIFSSVETGKNLERDSIVAKRCTPYRRFFKFNMKKQSHLTFEARIFEGHPSLTTTAKV